MNWVLIFIQVTTGQPAFLPTNSPPIYFETQEACEHVAYEFNQGRKQPLHYNFDFTGPAAICRATR